jgi:hypothetical protein
VAELAQVPYRWHLAPAVQRAIMNILGHDWFDVHDTSNSTPRARIQINTGGCGEMKGAKP